MTEQAAAVLVVATLLGGCATGRIPVERFLPAEGCYEKLAECDSSRPGELSRVYASGNSRISIPLRPLWQLATDDVPVENDRDREYRMFLTSFWGMSAVASIIEVRDGVLRSATGGIVFDDRAKAGSTRNWQADEVPGKSLPSANPPFRRRIVAASDKEVVVETSMVLDGKELSPLTTRDYWTVGQGVSRRELGGRCLYVIRRVECPTQMWVDFSKFPPRDFELGGSDADGAAEREDCGVRGAPGGHLQFP